MNPRQHCTHDTQRKTSNAVWPLRAADGRTFAERKAEQKKESEQ